MNRKGSEFLTGGYVAGDMPFQPKFKRTAKLDPSQVKFVPHGRDTEAKFVLDALPRRGYGPMTKLRKRSVEFRTAIYRNTNRTDKARIVNEKKLGKFNTRMDGTRGSRPSGRHAPRRQVNNRGKR